MQKLGLVLLVYMFSLNSCALFKRNRVLEQHKGIERSEFNLPIFIYPSTNQSTKKLLIFFSGDGGWIKFEEELSLKFANKGFQTIGVNSRNYFWKQKSPKQAEADVVQLIRKYAFKYKTNQIYFCGYSFGADVLPFIYNCLPYRAKRHVVALEMLSPFSTTSFKVHFSDLTNTSSDQYPYKVDQEVKKITVPIFCFYGADENEKHLQSIWKNNFHLSTLLGSHHYKETEYDKIVAALIDKK